MFYVLLMLCTTEGSKQIGMLRNSLANYCDGGTNTSAIVESKFLRGEENWCNFNIPKDVVSLSQNNLWIDPNNTDVLVSEINIGNTVLDVKILNNGVALVQMKSEAVFDDYVVLECFRKTNIKKLPSGNVFERVVNLGFDHQLIFSTTHQMSIPVVSDETCSTNDNSVCRGDSGGRMLTVSGWGVANTIKPRKCHWPAFWLVVCPWYGIQHCQSK